MTDHLSSATLNGLADGELSAKQLAAAGQHLADCHECVSRALQQSLLKLATTQAGQKFAPPPHLCERLTTLVSETKVDNGGMRISDHQPSFRGVVQRSGPLILATAAVLFLVFAGIPMLRYRTAHDNITSGERAALSNEVFDQHIATLASSLPPQVISSDRHTVKPWFQGKLPFSFNLPAQLPADTTLDGANLTYLQDQPVAQLLYSIGRHRVSVFLLEKSGRFTMPSVTEHAGFHVMVASIGELEGIAVSDVDSARMVNLVDTLEQAQSGAHPQSP